MVPCQACHGKGKVHESRSWQNMMLARMCLRAIDRGRELPAAQEMLSRLRADPKVKEYVELHEKDPEAAERKLKEEEQ